MIIKTLLGLALAAVLASPATAETPSPVGTTTRLLPPAPARNWRGAATPGLHMVVWYPAAPGTAVSSQDIGPPGRPLLRGHPGAAGAPLSSARPAWPLLMLSHGTGGTAEDLDWLAAGLAQAGFIVAGVEHPGNNAGEPLTREGFLLWWERATDLSEALDGILADPVLGLRIDRSRIGAMGFSLGGYTVLELAGARTNLQAFQDFCRSPQADAICRVPEMDRLKPGTRIDGPPSPEMAGSMARAGASYKDSRIRAVLAIAPALGMAFDAGAFREVDIPVALIGGTADTTVPVETNIRRIAGFVPRSEVTMIPGATHYTFIDACLPAGRTLLGPLCDDPPGVDRNAVHARAVATARAYFTRVLAATH